MQGGGRRVQDGEHMYTCSGFILIFGLEEGMATHPSILAWRIPWTEETGRLWSMVRMMHGGVSAPSCCAFTHRVAFEEVSGHRVLFKSVPENWGLSACGTTLEATSRISSGDRPHPEVHREGRKPLLNHAPWRPLSGLQEIPIATQEDIRILCFPSSRGLTHWSELSGTCSVSGRLKKQPSSS